MLAAAAVAVAAAALAGVGRPEAARSEAVQSAARTVTVVGEGTVTTVPDTASITAGVRTEASTAAAALAANAERMTRVIDALKRGGGRELQTRQVSLYPSTDESGATTGFVAQNGVEARTEIARAGELVDAAVAAGANTVDGPVLGRSDRDELYRDALGKAVEDAHAKATALARAGGFAVGEVVTIVEEGAADAGPYPLRGPRGRAGRVDACRAGDAGRPGARDGLVRDRVIRSTPFAIA